MKKTVMLVFALLLALALVACSPGINGAGQRITLGPHGVVVHVGGRPDAHVSRNGDLTIGGRSIATTPQQRALLKQYYSQATAVLGEGEALGKQGVQMAARGIGDAIASIFHGDASTAGKRTNADSKHIEAVANQLCGNLKTLDTTQDAIADQIPAFKPYAGTSHFVCNDTVSNAHGDVGITVSTSTPARPAEAHKP